MTALKLGSLSEHVSLNLSVKVSVSVVKIYSTHLLIVKDSKRVTLPPRHKLSAQNLCTKYNNKQKSVSSFRIKDFSGHLGKRTCL